MAKVEDAVGQEQPDDSLLVDELSLEDVLDQKALDEIDLSYARSEADFERRLVEGTMYENTFTPDELRELAEKVRRGEQATLKKS